MNEASCKKEDPMKHFLRLILIVLFFLPSMACGLFSMNAVNGSGNIITQTIDVSNFDRVSLEGSGDVYIDQGQTESLTIEADDNILPLLETKVRGSELILTTKPNQNINPSQKIVYRITVKDLNGVSLKGSGNFYIDPLKSDAMDVVLSGSGDIKFKDLSSGKLSLDLDGSGNIAADQLAAQAIDVSVRGSGGIKLAGTAGPQTVSFDGSGEYLAGDLETPSADVKIAGSADITVWATDELNVQVNGSGTVSYYGKPTVNQTGTGSGKIVSKGEK
jgi:hypothetical protein